MQQRFRAGQKGRLHGLGGLRHYGRIGQRMSSPASLTGRHTEVLRIRRILRVVPASTYDSILVVSFGGPEKPDDVIPFLENVLRGRDVPRERLLAVAEHYYHFGGRSPINDQNRALIAALELELRQHGSDLPVYWGNRNWHKARACRAR